MSGEAKVLTGLLERRALEQAFAALGRITDPAAVQQQAQTIAEYGSAALQHLLTLLDTPDPQLRGGLGQVARYLPRDQVVPALRAVARGHERSDQARLAAITLLERFLGETVDSAMIDNLGNPDLAARQSLLELVAAMDEEPLSVVEYLEQLGQQPPEVAGMVLDALPAVESGAAGAGSAGAGAHLATLLRMLAQGEDVRLARRAIDELIRQRTPAALRALAGLVPNLPPPLAPAAERGLRKLRFSGVQESADHDPAREPWYAPELQWRALLSSLDPQGGQFIWFVGIEPPRPGEAAAPGSGQRAVFFTVLTQDPGGLRDASGALHAAADHVPPKRREGALHYIVGGGAAPDEDAPGLTLLEAPFGIALAGLREALALNWAGGNPTPMGYRLFSPLIWLADEAQAAGAAGTARAPSHGEADLTPEAVAGRDGEEADELAVVLDHPAFYGWFLGAEEPPLKPAAAASYARRFRAMSRWLDAAGDAETGRAAAAIAYHFENRTPTASSILAAAIRGRQDSKD